MATKDTGWLCTHTASITASTNTTVTITVTCYWQNNGWNYDISNVSAWVYCNGTSYQVKNAGSVSISSTSGKLSMGSHAFTINKTTSTQNISCYGKIISNSSYVSGTKSSSSASVSVPAKPSYTVSYNANGGSGAPSSQTKWYGTNLSLSSTIPTRTGYSFSGWGTSSSSTSIAYAAGATYSSNASVTLYAIWKANTYTISYNANGGSGAPGNQTKTYGVNLKLSSTVPSRTNYNFKGWGTSSSSTSVAYAAGATYSSNTSVTLYAIWELAYIAPRISEITIGRCDSNGSSLDEGQHALVKFKWATDKTISSIKIWYKQSSSTTWSDPYSISASGTSGSVSKVVGAGTLSTENTYDIYIEVADSSGKTSVIKTLSGLLYPIDFLSGGNGVAMGKPAERSGFFENAFKAYFDSSTYLKKGYNVHSFNGTSGTTGYVKFATITILKNYQNQPISMKIAQRGHPEPTEIFLQFSSTNSTDPSLSSFRIRGYPKTFYAYKNGSGIWDLYAQKSEAYDSLVVLDVSYGYDYMTVDIEWKNEHANSLPSGYVSSWNAPIGQSASGYATWNGTGIEMFGSTPYLDFHNNNSSADYTTRIVADGSNYITINPNLRVSGWVECISDGVYLPNSGNLKGKTTSGTYYELASVSSSNNCVFGWGSYKNGGYTNIYGSNIQLLNTGAGITFMPSDNSTYNGFFSPNTANKTCLGDATKYWYRVYAGMSQWTPSDIRVKQNIKSYDERFEKMYMDLKPITYELKDNPGQSHCGLIVQWTKDSMDKYKILPYEFGVYEYDAANDIYGIIYPELTSLNIYMIQKTIARVNESEKETKKQKEEIDRLKKELEEERIECLKLKQCIRNLDSKLNAFINGDFEIKKNNGEE